MPKSSTDTRSLEHVLKTLAFHVVEMYTTPAGKTHTSGLSYGDEVALVEIKIESAGGSFKDVNDAHKVCGTLNIWDRCTVNGVAAGNRHGAYVEMMKVYAPIIALAAAANVEAA